MNIHVPFARKSKGQKGSYRLTESGSRLYQTRFSQEPELLVLSALTTMGMGTISEIEASTRLDGRTVKNAIRNLEKKGFVTGAE